MSHARSKLTIHYNIPKDKTVPVKVFNRQKRIMNTNQLIYVFVSQPGTRWF